MVFKKQTKFSGLDPTTSQPNIYILKQANLDGVKMQPDMLDFFNSIKIDPENHSYLLINVMGASDYYGANLNGDWFAEEDLITYHKTFEQGHVFENHTNSDPNEGFGRVIFASYNKAMHRVELLIEMEKSDPRTKKVLTMIDNGKFPRVSMGTKVMFDECMICGNKARTREEYCEHAKNKLGKLLPDGRRVAVKNPNPRFFDISIVTTEADRSSGYLAKVASVVTKENPFTKERLEEAEEGIEKEVVEKGEGETLDDVVEGKEKIIKDIGCIDAHDEPLDDDLLDILSDHPLKEVFATMSGLGMKVKPREFTHMALKPILGGRGIKITIKKHMRTGPIVIRKKASKERFSYLKDFNPNIAKLLLPEMQKRSYFPQYLKTRVARKGEGAYRPMAIENEKLANIYSDYINTTINQHPLSLEMTLRKNAWLVPHIKGDGEIIKEACISTATIDSNLWKVISDGKKLLKIAYWYRNPELVDS